MREDASSSAWEFYAQTYDVTVGDWPGEMDFYRALVAQVQPAGQAVLELACGTGRVAIRLAQAGARVVGLDLSAAMVAAAREKSAGMDNLRWVQGDMRSFDLGETFGLILIPGHSFQNIVTAADQVACLESVKRHLAPGGLLVVHLDHQSVGWLGDLTRDKGGVFENVGQLTHPQTGRPVRTLHAWSYEPATQTAIAQTVWEELGPDGEVTGRWDTGPYRIHCVFRFEMEHLLGRVGLELEAVYGDFDQQELQDDSPQMIWLARRP